MNVFDGKSNQFFPQEKLEKSNTFIGKMLPI